MPKRVEIEFDTEEEAVKFVEAVKHGIHASLPGFMGFLMVNDDNYPYALFADREAFEFDVNTIKLIED